MQAILRSICAINKEILVHLGWTHRKIAFILALSFWRFEIRISGAITFDSSLESIFQQTASICDADYHTLMRNMMLGWQCLEWSPTGFHSEGYEPLRALPLHASF